MLTERPAVDHPEGFTALARLLGGRRAVVLTGAGCSTESGIPDYRGPDGRLRARLPMRYQEFMGERTARARYWSRSAVGWPRFSAARPNRAHHALAELEELGTVTGIITQNVDGLHQAAGSRRVVELHGSLAEVRCMQCRELEDRRALQRRLEATNPGLEARAGRIAPDGDVELPPRTHASFVVPTCVACEGVLKPDVVFFGENVPAARVEEAWRLFETADVLLVVGSSLSVFSGRRFVIRAQKVDRPVAILNRGPTRGDGAAEVKVDGAAGELLPRLVATLRSTPPDPARRFEESSPP